MEQKMLKSKGGGEDALENPLMVDGNLLGAE
jgi:hypothetical protein